MSVSVMAYRPRLKQKVDVVTLRVKKGFTAWGGGCGVCCGGVKLSYLDC